MDEGEKKKAGDLEASSEHHSPVGDEAVVVDVPRQPKDGDAGSPEGNDESRPYPNTDEEEPDEKPNGCQDTELNQEYSKEAGPEGHSQWD